MKTLKPLVALFIAVVLVAVVSGAAPADAQGRAPAATNIQVVNGHNPGEVIISWDTVPEATYYRIGYVNMETDYPLAKASRTGNWLEAFVYVDVEAQNFAAGTVYTIRRLEQGARHAFAVLTNDSAYGEPTWPTNPPWKFLVVTDQGGACPTTATPQGPTNIDYDIAPNVPADQVEIITEGLQMAQDFLDTALGGGIPEDARKDITVKIVATGRGNEEPGGDGACCTAGTSRSSGSPTMRPFFDVAHPSWIKFGGLQAQFWSHAADHRKIAIHEYTHLWQFHLGCSGRSRLGNWLSEGMAEYIAYEAMIKSGDMPREGVMDHMLNAARSTGQLDRPIRDFAEGAIRDIGIWPGHVGFLALHHVVPSAPDGILSLRTLCQEAGDGASVPEAFHTAFGVGLDDFYADFEEYRQELNSPGGERTEAETATETMPNLKVAFIGDQGRGSSARAVLELIRDEGAVMVLHQGDFDYSDDPEAWDGLISGVLGPSFPYFASVGNHDVNAWAGAEGYQQKLLDRLSRIPGARCVGEYGVKAACTYQGLFFILSGAGTLGSGHAAYIREQLAGNDSVWSICSWHKNQRAMQVGGKSDEVGWGPYEACREGGAIIATGHEHSYSRTKTLNNTEFQTGAPLWPDPDAVRVGDGSTFVFVSGLGGASIRTQERCRPTTPPYGCNGEWASIYTSEQAAKYGALFIEFNVDGNPRKAVGYFKNIDGEAVDSFTVVATESTPGPAATTDPSYVKWEVGRNVPPEFLVNGKRAVRLVDQYAVDLGLSDFNREVTIYLVQEFDDVVDLSMTLSGRSREEAAADWANIYGEAGRDWIMIRTSAFSPGTLRSVYRSMSMVGRQLIHVYQYELGNSVVGPHNAHLMLYGGPTWIKEGSSVFLAYQSYQRSGELDYPRDRIVELGNSDTVKLRDLETWNDYFRFHNGVRNGPGLGALAAELLASRAGQPAFFDYYRKVKGGATWQDAFRTTFGMSIAEFYQLFAAHRTAEFPRPKVAGVPTTATPAGTRLPTGPTNIDYDIAPNVPADQVEIITEGLQMAQDFLDSALGGGIPEDARKDITVKIVATGRGNEESGGSGACCTAGSSETGGVLTMRLFFDVAHPVWKSKTEMGTRNANNRKIAVHEYAHIWQLHLGCSSGRSSLAAGPSITTTVDLITHLAGTRPPGPPDRPLG